MSWFSVEKLFAAPIRNAIICPCFICHVLSHYLVICINTQWRRADSTKFLHFAQLSIYFYSTTNNQSTLQVRLWLLAAYQTFLGAFCWWILGWLAPTLLISNSPMSHHPSEGIFECTSWNYPASFNDRQVRRLCTVEITLKTIWSFHVRTGFFFLGPWHLLQEQNLPQLLSKV